ncbi:OLC1v1029245C1 [Oldenlandia corymbosa var. corymbosa]|uniref:OLC1v1029245C1 n=1 Tax=Oldenlandia corymbosa var. corymbosa TaxID=529605 RepID=A0AAV1CGH6_OLDCO|nr:OLC1v1029245C1 [Oldenlandia corymbosa var. corymbosa]
MREEENIIITPRPGLPSLDVVRAALQNAPVPTTPDDDATALAEADSFFRQYLLSSSSSSSSDEEDEENKAVRRADIRRQVVAVYQAMFHSSALPLPDTVLQRENPITDSAQTSSSVRAKVPRQLTGQMISDRTMRLLSDRRYQPREYHLCPLCLNGLVTGEFPVKLDCGHGCHMGCIKRWLDVKNICPSCGAVALTLL